MACQARRFALLLRHVESVVYSYFCSHMCSYFCGPSPTVPAGMVVDRRCMVTRRGCPDAPGSCLCCSWVAERSCAAAEHVADCTEPIAGTDMGTRRQSVDSSRLSVDTSYRMSGDYARGAELSERASFESMQARPLLAPVSAAHAPQLLAASFLTNLAIFILALHLRSLCLLVALRPAWVCACTDTVF